MISAIILSHNDCERIGKALESVAWCDEVIVVDDNSSDGTDKIVKKHKAQFIVHSVNNDFAAQRNFALEKVKGEWALFLDSDEVVSKELASEIKKATQSEEYEGYFLKRQDFLFGKALKYGETANVKLLRLGKKGKGEWGRPIHETWNIAGNVGTLSSPLLHYPHQTITEFLADINNYSTMNAKYFYRSGVRVSWWHVLAYPVGKFLKDYVVLQGFRDGTCGAIVAIMMSFHSFLTRGKIFMMQKK